MYLSSLQNGLQAAHCLGEMFLKYNHSHFKGSDERAILEDWVTNDKTIIILNGGNTAELNYVYDQLMSLSLCMTDIFDEGKSKLPYAKFHEDEQSLNKALTCVGIIIPESTYNTPIENCVVDDYYKEMSPQDTLRLLLAKYRLAH